MKDVDEIPSANETAEEVAAAVIEVVESITEVVTGRL